MSESDAAERNESLISDCFKFWFGPFCNVVLLWEWLERVVFPRTRGLQMLISETFWNRSDYFRDLAVICTGSKLLGIEGEISTLSDSWGGRGPGRVSSGLCSLLRRLRALLRHHDPRKKNTTTCRKAVKRGRFEFFKLRINLSKQRLSFASAYYLVQASVLCKNWAMLRSRYFLSQLTA